WDPGWRQSQRGSFREECPSQPRCGIRTARHQEDMSVNYNQPHRFYGGVGLHARSMYVHVLDHKGKTVFEKDLPADPQAFLNAIQPYRKSIVVGCECMFAWYWLADLCEAEKIPFVLGHALAMRHIHQSKSKSDRIDGGKLAALLRGGLFPMAYVYPKAKRQTRDLMRRRSFFGRQRPALHRPEHAPHDRGRPGPHRRLRRPDRPAGAAPGPGRQGRRRGHLRLLAQRTGDRADPGPDPALRDRPDHTLP